MQTELDTRVRAYFSAGLIVVRRCAGLLSQWQADFLRLVEATHFPPQTGISRMDEVSLVATLTRNFDRLQILNGQYNYLIYGRSQLASPWRQAQLEDLIHVHYRRWFNKPNFLRLVQPALDPTSKILQWLERHLPFEPTLDEPFIPG